MTEPAEVALATSSIAAAAPLTVAAHGKVAVSPPNTGLWVPAIKRPET